MNLVIGSGDIAALMAGIQTKTYQDLLRKFVDENKPYYNALASPIDALRTGAILETNYLKTLSDDYFIQVKVTSKEMDVFTSSLDFAKISNGRVIDFDELKTISIADYIDIVQPIAKMDEQSKINFIKKKFKKYYNQVQAQLYCADIDSANLVFLSVDSYNDEDNYKRVISSTEYTKVRIKRDPAHIDAIREKGLFFQNIKNHFK